MNTRWLSLAATACLVGSTIAQADPFPREGDPAQRAKKDPLEGKAPPALQVRDWLNTDGIKAGGGALTLAELRGHVVLIDFWGVW
ncbi:MAG TPA: hypothetical protein VFZ65_20150 [Planctomycetota bacterium]|nr:hypothetical protein [Planctomycetota bacterium]